MNPCSVLKGINIKIEKECSSVSSLDSLPHPCPVLTDSDIKFEKECRSARRDFLLQVRLYNEQTKEFFKTQRDAADALWKVSVKYNILLEACPRGIYPAEITDQVMSEMLVAKDEQFSKMQSARTEWQSGEAYVTLRHLYDAFQRSTRPLKWSFPSNLIKGSARERPLKFYVDSALDTMYYYERLHTHVEATFRAITLYASDAMTAYSKALTYSPQFERLLADLLLFGHVLMQQDGAGIGGDEKRSR